MAEYFQVDKEKPEGTPVYPAIRSRVELLMGLVAGYVKAEPVYKKIGWASTCGDSQWERFVEASAHVSTLGESRADFGVYMEVYDRLHNTVTVQVDGGDTVSSIPVYVSKAVGYRPMCTGERVLYYDPAEKKWVPRWVADHRRKGDTVELAVGDDEYAASEWVPMHNVLRETVVGKKPDPAAATKLEAVWEN